MHAGLSRMAKLAGALGVVLGCAAFTLFARHFEGYFPLAEKITLEYELVRQKPDGSIEKGRLFVTNLAPMRLANKTVVPRRYDLKMQDGLKQSYSIFFHNDQEGILFFGFQTDKEAQPQVASPPYYYLKNPLKVGASWGEGDSPKGKVESLSEAVTVPAGTFTNCLRIKITFPPNKPLAEGLFWYGEKVGIVKSAYLYRNALKEEFRLVSIKE